MTIYSAAILLFLVMDPLGNIPVFLAVLKDVPAAKRKKIIFRELLISLAVLLVFLFLGRHILDTLDLSEPSLSISGGIILFIIALKMIFSGPEGGGFGINPDREPFIVPLAIPLVAGPSAMASVLLLATREPSRMFDWFVALVSAWVVTSIILILSTVLSRALGHRGLIAMERLMGMILTTISVQMFLNGVKMFMAI
jgi:multiple antibiotic resistance protein